MSEPARQIATVQETNVVPISGSTMMDVIARAASDPTVDVDKLERLLGMAERVRADEARQAFATAMNACQAELTRVSADAKNPQTKSDYASYAALDRAVRPVYARHGFSLSFSTAEGAPTDYLRLVCHVAHAGGHTVDHQVDMPADGKGAKGGDVMTKTHAVGAAMSYGQRYLLKLIFNIAVGDDDDGNTNGGKAMSQAAQDAVAEINTAEGSAALIAWRDKRASGFRGRVSAAEWSEIISLWNRRAKAAKDANNG